MINRRNYSGQLSAEVKGALRRTLLKLMLLLALFAGGFLLGYVTASLDAPPSDTRSTEAVLTPIPSELSRISIAVSDVPKASEGARSTEAVLTPIPSEPSPISTAAPEVGDAPKAIPVKTSTEVPPSAQLRSDEVRETQAWLKVLGFDPGPIDGSRGPQTSAAVKRYQAARHREETGELDRSLLQQVRQEVGH